jgi:hypothetical protein
MTPAPAPHLSSFRRKRESRCFGVTHRIPRGPECDSLSGFLFLTSLLSRPAFPVRLLDSHLCGNDDGRCVSAVDQFDASHSAALFPWSDVTQYLPERWEGTALQRVRISVRRKSEERDAGKEGPPSSLSSPSLHLKTAVRTCASERHSVNEWRGTERTHRGSTLRAARHNVPWCRGGAAALAPAPRRTARDAHADRTDVRSLRTSGAGSADQRADGTRYSALIAPQVVGRTGITPAIR